MKIRAKLFITFFSISIILAASLLSIVYFTMVAHFEQQEGNQLKENVRQSAKEIDDFMFTRVKDFNAFSNNPLFSLSSNETISIYLTRVVEQYHFYEHISFVNKDGTIEASSSHEEVGLKLLDFEPDIEEEFHKTLIGGDDDVYISDKALMKEARENLHLDIELLSNVIDLNGNVIGVLVGIVDFDFIKDIVRDIDERTIGDEYAYLVNDPGDIIVTENPDIKSLEPHPDLSINNLQQKLEGDKNGFNIYKNSKGIKVISGYADLSEYGTNRAGDWSLLSTAPYDIIMNPIYEMLYKVLFAFTFILIAIFLLAINFSNTLSKPIIQLQKAISEFDMNSKPLKLKIGKNDEIHSLSSSFNAMSEKIYNSSEERRHIEKELEESKQYLDNIINNIGDPVFVKDDKSNFLLANDAFYKLFNRSKDEILGKTFAEDVPQEERERYLKVDNQVISNGVENVNEDSINIKGGETRFISTKKTRFIDDAGNKLLIGVIRDITKQKKAEVKLIESESNLRHSQIVANIGSYSFNLKDNTWKSSKVLDIILGINEIFVKDYETFMNLIHPSDRELFQNKFEKSIKNNEKFNQEYRIINKLNNKEVWVNTIGELQLDEEGNPVKMVGTTQDITERKLIEEALLKTNERNELMYSATNDSVWDYDLGTNIIWWNQGVTKLFGHTLENNESTPDWWVNNIHPEEKERVEKFFFDLINSEESVWEDEYRFKCNDGSYKYVYDRGIVRRDKNGKALRMVGAMMDITLRKQAEIELNKYKNHLEELVEIRTNQLEKETIKAQSADLMKSAFLATMSHELRTPMNSIIGFTGILLKEFAGPVNVEQKKQLLMVKNSGHHLLGLINDILDISKIEAGKLKVSKYPFDFVSILEKTIEFLSPQANKKGLRINSEYSKAKIILNSDERRIEQVVLNLISNAIKFSNQGTILVKVTVHNNLLSTQIIDQGIGIRKEDLNKLFVPFIQLESGLTRSHEGTGLGLSICKSLLEKLGGTIEVKSKMGEGSNFTFNLPI